MGTPIFLLAPFHNEIVSAVAGKDVPFQVAELGNFTLKYQPPHLRPPLVKKAMSKVWGAEYPGARCIVPEKGSSVRGIIYDFDKEALERLADFNFHGVWMNLREVPVRTKVMKEDGSEKEVAVSLFVETVIDENTLHDIPEGLFEGDHMRILEARMAISAQIYQTEREQRAQKESFRTSQEKK